MNDNSNNNNNPYAHQKITSKELFIESNYVKKDDEEDDKGSSIVGILLCIGLIVGSIGFYIYYIYPTYIKSSYTIEEACANPYECGEVSEDGFRTCSYFDSHDRKVFVRCKGVTTTSSSTTKEKTTSND